MEFLNGIINCGKFYKASQIFGQVGTLLKISGFPFSINVTSATTDFSTSRGTP